MNDRLNTWPVNLLTVADTPWPEQEWRAELCLLLRPTQRNPLLARWLRLSWAIDV